MACTEPIKELYKQVIQMEYEDIISKYGNALYLEKYRNFYKGWIEFNKEIKLTSQNKLENELKWGLYKFIQK